MRMASALSSNLLKSALIFPKSLDCMFELFENGF